MTFIYIYLFKIFKIILIFLKIFFKGVNFFIYIQIYIIQHNINTIRLFYYF